MRRHGLILLFAVTKSIYTYEVVLRSATELQPAALKFIKLLAKNGAFAFTFAHTQNFTNFCGK